ncbi:hypothetical protein ACFY04_19490 [Streptomyces sp. NPDC001549]|uniref:hypothetical protein n=1 Tax=Streptomyces sp. NPDC001549 TaxID=3364586 RepID=UPI0036C2DDE1
MYAFPEGAIGYVELHRDVESLVFAPVELRKVETDRGNGVAPEVLAARFREAVGTFDPTVFHRRGIPVEPCHGRARTRDLVNGPAGCASTRADEHVKIIGLMPT